ncbi:hypothetical protein TWF481_006203 [Arthrobotrys musiformis]|uniref:Uncharacterized protein n=1 Tax=Arthrobotrys musiformis TaxID=47236 RepID=A0AAV9WFY9_9PEZI
MEYTASFAPGENAGLYTGGHPNGLGTEQARLLESIVFSDFLRRIHQELEQITTNSISKSQLYKILSELALSETPELSLAIKKEIVENPIIPTIDVPAYQGYLDVVPETPDYHFEDYLELNPYPSPSPTSPESPTLPLVEYPTPAPTESPSPPRESSVIEYCAAPPTEPPSLLPQESSMLFATECSIPPSTGSLDPSVLRSPIKLVGERQHKSLTPCSGFFINKKFPEKIIIENLTIIPKGYRPKKKLDPMSVGSAKILKRSRIKQTARRGTA